MKRKSKLLTLLFSAALVCTNASIVYAADISSTEVSADEESMEETISEDSSSEHSASEAEQVETENSEETADAGDASDENVSDENASGKDASINKDTSDEQDAETAEDEQEEHSDDAEPETESDTTGTFTNKSGETIIPSDLIGMDYTTIADTYDGDTNVIKQYQPSDSQEANIILDCYLDEDGNLIIIISQGNQAEKMTDSESKPKNKDVRKSRSGSAPAIDGSFSGWEKIPVSYEYNWDNSANCWQYGCWMTNPETGEQICYKTEEGTYDSNVRHEMQLYCDDENIYLRIKYATIYYETRANGDDFNFYIDDASAKFSVNWPDGSPITGKKADAGTYAVDVRNGDSASSYSIVDGACAYYRVTENGINNELELKIPLEALQAQNGSINLDNYSMVQFFTPNLMYRRISTAGSSTGALPFAAAAFLGIPAGYVWLKKKDKAE